MRDRLIKLVEECGDACLQAHVPLTSERIADHLLTNGVILSPVEIGQTVYHIASCKDFRHELDGSLYDGNGGPGDATGYYCPCELRSNCPFDSEEEFDCDEKKGKLAVFEDEVKGIMLGECDYDNVVFLGYSGNVYFREFGKTLFASRKEADQALELKCKER
ncbi:MAG: hypothetical protein IJV68_03740 [Clostridia bacterium]|nr:hypothetical protein [Clostridia bacterium]